MKRAIVMVGAQYAGKSHLCRHIAATHAEAAHICLDDIRDEKGLKRQAYENSRDLEDVAHEKMWDLTENALERGATLILLDAWNRDRPTRKYYCRNLRGAGIERITAWQFMTPLDLIIRQSFEREPVTRIPVLRVYERQRRFERCFGQYEDFQSGDLLKEGLFDDIRQLDPRTVDVEDLLWISAHHSD